MMTNGARDEGRTTPLLELEANRWSSPSWVKLSDGAHGLKAHSFHKHCRFTDTLVRTLTYTIMFAPPILFVLVYTTDLIRFDADPMTQAGTWLSGALFALIAYVFLYGYVNSDVEHVLQYNPSAQTLEIQQFNRKGIHVSRDIIKVADVKSIYLVDDEGVSRTVQTHAATPFQLRIRTDKGRHHLLMGKEEEIWPVYLRLRDLCPNLSQPKPPGTWSFLRRWNV
ncbi:MAG: hypothetical protein AAFR75_00555 [Pseudomonadota bacterium]